MSVKKPRVKMDSVLIFRGRRALIYQDRTLDVSVDFYDTNGDYHRTKAEYVNGKTAIVFKFKGLWYTCPMANWSSARCRVYGYYWSAYGYKPALIARTNRAQADSSL